MLRQALDEAAKGAARTSSSDAALDSESTSLAHDSGGTSTSRGDYGSTSLATKREEEGESGDYDSLDEEDDEGDSQVRGSWPRVWQRVKDAVILILNVDNLWDEEIGFGEALSRTDHLVVLFWFFLLAMAYAGERSSFYLIVDRTGPFRLFSAEMITALHALLLAAGMGIAAISRRTCHVDAAAASRRTWHFDNKFGVPLVDVALMALLDAAALILALITGYHVPPTLTVILVQFTLPLTIIFTQMVHPDGRVRSSLCPVEKEESETATEEHKDQASDDDEEPIAEDDEEQAWVELDPFVGRPLPRWGGLSFEHLFGSALICTAVFLGLCPAFIAILHPEVFAYADVLPVRTAYNSLVFALACIPAAASQLYKEHVFLQHKQPVDASSLNAILSALQFTFIMIVSPLVYTLQGMAAPGNWTLLYPSVQFSANFFDGLKCFIGTLDEEQARTGYADPAVCRHSLILVMFHVLSIIVVGVAVDKIVHAGATKVMYRGISAGIILAVISMYIYDLYDPDFNYGPAVDGLHLVCTTLIVVGSEVYHRVSMKDSTFETVYPEIEPLYDDD